MHHPAILQKFLVTKIALTVRVILVVETPLERSLGELPGVYVLKIVLQNTYLVAKARHVDGQREMRPIRVRNIVSMSTTQFDSIHSWNGVDRMIPLSSCISSLGGKTVQHVIETPREKRANACCMLFTDRRSTSYVLCTHVTSRDHAHIIRAAPTETTVNGTHIHARAGQF